MGVGRPGGGPRPDRRRSSDLIRDQLRVAAAVTAVGFVVGAVVGGLGGRLAMRVLAITSDDRLKGLLTDDEARVNQFTLGGTVGLVLFVGFGGVALAVIYLAARRAMPRSVGLRAAIYGALFWSLMGSGVFDPDGFDFRRLSPRWLAVLMFTVIFVAVGALVALGVERYVDAWPRRLPALVPLMLFAPIFPAVPFVVVFLGLTWAVEHWRPMRIAGSVAVAVPFAIWGGPTAANVMRILV